MTHNRLHALQSEAAILLSISKTPKPLGVQPLACGFAPGWGRSHHEKSLVAYQATTAFLCVLAFLVVLSMTSTAGAEQRTSLSEARNRMVDEEIVAAGIKDPRVIEAIRKVPRHEFIPLAQRKWAYLDMALPIGESQTISPPFVVANMTEQLEPKPTDIVLEIGTGSGYQAAVLSGLVREVYTIEIVPALGQRAAKTLKQLGYNNVHAKVGDGYKGWPEHAPFDKIIVTCSPEGVPTPLIAQLKEGGRMVIPVGERYQQTLYLLKKEKGKLVPEALKPTLFVPMTGQAETARKIQPDPANPELRNGDFEETTGNPPQAAAWHYQRQTSLVEAADSPSGKHYLSFRNTTPGRPSQALQGLAIDGRKVKQLDITLRVRGQDIRPAQAGAPFPRIIISFYDDNRGPAGDVTVAQWRGTFAWQAEHHRIDVPVRAREAVIQITMLGALGELSIDDMQVKKNDER